STFDAFGRWQVASGPGVYPQVDYREAKNLANGSGVIVAVLDNGMSLRNPAIAAQALPGRNFLAGNDNTGDIPYKQDSNKNGIQDEALGHGTMVAGIVLQFAPRAQLMPVKILTSDGQGNIWTILQGIQYAVDRGARVVVCTTGLPLSSKLLT